MVSIISLLASFVYALTALGTDQILTDIKAMYHGNEVIYRISGPTKEILPSFITDCYVHTKNPAEKHLKENEWTSIIEYKHMLTFVHGTPRHEAMCRGRQLWRVALNGSFPDRPVYKIENGQRIKTNIRVQVNHVCVGRPLGDTIKTRQWMEYLEGQKGHFALCYKVN